MLQFAIGVVSANRRNAGLAPDFTGTGFYVALRIWTLAFKFLISRLADVRFKC